MFDAKQLVKDREKTHGSFSDNAKTSQTIKRLFCKTPLTDVQKEAIDMIANKLSRISTGDPNDPDHWRDIAGFATLVVQDLEGGRSTENAIAQLPYWWGSDYYDPNGIVQTSPSPPGRGCFQPNDDIDA